MADIRDLKSLDRKVVWVRVPLWAPTMFLWFCSLLAVCIAGAACYIALHVCILHAREMRHINNKLQELSKNVDRLKDSQSVIVSFVTRMKLDRDAAFEALKIKE